MRASIRVNNRFPGMIVMLLLASEIVTPRWFVLSEGGSLVASMVDMSDSFSNVIVSVMVMFPGSSLIAEIFIVSVMDTNACVKPESRTKSSSVLLEVSSIGDEVGVSVWLLVITVTSGSRIGMFGVESVDRLSSAVMVLWLGSVVVDASCFSKCQIPL